nr:MAG TPA: hypothetical protein [Caudoviricetes sp.]
MCKRVYLTAKEAEGRNYALEDCAYYRIFEV